jgi:phosphotriesterase-related protein
MAHLITTLGPKRADELGMILPHEHIFVDLRTPDEPGQGEADPEDVVRLMVPELEKARAAGITAIVDCGPVGVGRRADILRIVSEAADFPLIVPTGIYREPWVPQWAQRASEGELREWMQAELEGEIESSGVQAAWIKLSAGDDGMTDGEARILRAATAAAKATNAVIGSHTVRGRVVQDQLAIIEQSGYSPERFIWIHAQNEPDGQLHLDLARRGVWIEYDAIGSEQLYDGVFLRLVERMLETGLGDRVLLSHDRGWYDPAQPGGGTPRPFTYISERFLPQLRQDGVDEATIHQLTRTNPFHAFAR